MALVLSPRRFLSCVNPTTFLLPWSPKQIADLHATLLGTDKASSSSSPNKKFSSSMAIKCRHPDFVSFKFPNKSMFNTFAGHTLERRRQGFADFFKVLLKVWLIFFMSKLYFSGSQGSG